MQERCPTSIVENGMHGEVIMISPVIRRKWAREYLARAQHAQSRGRKLHFLRLAVRNSVHAQNLENGAASRPSDAAPNTRN